MTTSVFFIFGLFSCLLSATFCFLLIQMPLHALITTKVISFLSAYLSVNKIRRAISAYTRGSGVIPGFLLRMTMPVVKVGMACGYRCLPLYLPGTAGGILSAAATNHCVITL